MRIRTLHIGCLWPSERSGGADRVLADLATHLPPHGIDVQAVVAGPANPEAPAGVAVRTFGDPDAGFRARCLGARREVCALVDSGQVDLVASHFALYASTALDRLCRVPHVVHFHGPWAAESRQEGAGYLSSFAKRCIERMVYKSADGIIVLSHAFGTLAERHYGVAPSRLHLIPGAVDYHRFAIEHSRADARAALGWPADRRILVTVRRLVYRAGIDLLLDALPAIVSRVPDVLLYIGGTGPQLGPLRARAAALGLERQIVFLGHVADAQLPLVYRAADINVVPTRALEGFGLTAVEALAVGTPSMVTPVGGLPEAVAALSPALVFKSSDPADMAEGLSAALTGTLTLASGPECQRFAQERFSAELMAARVATVYRNVCDARRGASHAD